MKLLCSVPAIVRVAAYLLLTGFVLGLVIGYQVAEAAVAAGKV